MISRDAKRRDSLCLRSLALGLGLLRSRGGPAI
jgi:hypothetical protein